MSNVGIGWCIFILSAVILSLTSCTTGLPPDDTSQEMAEYVPDPSPAGSLDELVENLSSDDPSVRIVSAYALDQYGKEAEIAVPALIDNLSYEGFSDVRRSAAVALGKLGPDAQLAVPKLISVAQNEMETHQVRSAVVEALGEIGDKTAVPALVGLLFQKDSRSTGLDRESAKSIAEITGERFTDSGEEDKVYALNEEGIPLIVLDARKWWEEKGRHMDW